VVQGDLQAKQRQFFFYGLQTISTKIGF